MPANRSINLVLLPGLLADAQLWRHQLQTLKARAVLSVGDLTAADSIAGLAASVLAQAPAGPFALAGLSMGGYVALEIMRQAPQRIVALALLDTSARPDTAEATANRHKQIEQAHQDFSRIAPAMAEKLLHPDHVPALSDILQNMADNIGVQGFAGQQRAIMSRIDSRPFLHRIACPTLVLCGREDPITPVEIHEEMMACIPRATMTVVEHCGHLSSLEQPEAVTDAMRIWLESVA
jgi:pimeloyl-ACP methyl ester carboxylesterase